MATGNPQRGAVVVHRGDHGIDVRFELLPSGELDRDSVRVRPEFVGICGSDLEQIFGSMDSSFGVRFPHILGHEWSGTVIAAGDGVSTFRTGDRVIGHGSLGGNTWFGVSTDGAMADTFDVPAAMCFAVPEPVSAQRAALIEPLACCLQALRVAGGADAGHKAAVFGCGAIGSAMVALLHGLGTEVVAIDRSEPRLALAAKLGADHTVTAGEGSAERIRDTLGAGADLVIEASGSPVAQADAIEVTADGARVLFMGLAHQSAQSVPLYQIQARGLRLFSSTGAPPSVWQPTLRLVARTGIDLTPIVSHVFDFAECRAALEAARDSASNAKIMLRPGPAA